MWRGNEYGPARIGKEFIQGTGQSEAQERAGGANFTANHIMTRRWA